MPQFAVIRMFSIAQAFGYIYYATAERFTIRALASISEINGRSFRVFATILVDDYEKRPRRLNALLAMLFMDVVVLFISVILVTGASSAFEV